MSVYEMIDRIKTSLGDGGSLSCPSTLQLNSSGGGGEKNGVADRFERCVCVLLVYVGASLEKGCINIAWVVLRSVAVL